MPDSARQFRVAANWTVAAFLPVSAIGVTVTADALPDIGDFLLGTVVLDLGLCMFLGFVCMLLGFGRAIAKREWFEPEPLIGFGAALGVVVFTAFEFLSYAAPDEWAEKAEKGSG